MDGRHETEKEEKSNGIKEEKMNRGKALPKIFHTDVHYSRINDEFIEGFLKTDKDKKENVVEVGLVGVSSRIDSGGNDIIWQVVNSLKNNMDDENIMDNINKLKQYFGDERVLNACVTVIFILQTFTNYRNCAKKILKTLEESCGSY